MVLVKLAIKKGIDHLGIETLHVAFYRQTHTCETFQESLSWAVARKVDDAFNLPHSLAASQYIQVCGFSYRQSAMVSGLIRHIDFTQSISCCSSLHICRAK